MGRGRKGSIKHWLKRRTVLKGMAAVGAVSLAAPLVACGDRTVPPPAGSDDVAPEVGGTDEPPPPQLVTVFRFQTRKGNTCAACRNHQHYKVFVDEATADQTRAHPGCNCAIVAQRMPQDYWEAIADYAIDGAVDLRAVYA